MSSGHFGSTFQTYVLQPQAQCKNQIFFKGGWFTIVVPTLLYLSLILITYHLSNYLTNIGWLLHPLLVVSSRNSRTRTAAPSAINAPSVPGRPNVWQGRIVWMVWNVLSHDCIDANQVQDCIERVQLPLCCTLCFFGLKCGSVCVHFLLNKLWIR